MQKLKLQIKKQNWRKVKLGEIAQNFDSKRIPLSSMQRAKMKGLYPYYGAAEIVDYINNYIYDGFYLLIAEDGTVTTDGNKPMLQLVNGKFWVNNHAHVIWGNNDLETKYLFYALRNTPITPYITGAVQLKLTQENLNKIELPYPSDESVRKKVVDILSTFDDKIELNSKISQNLEQMAQSIFKEWFIKFKFPGHKKVKMLNSELGKIPEGWEMVNAEKIFTFEKGVEPGSGSYSITRKTNFIPFYRVRDLEEKSGDTDVFIDEKVANNKICKCNDVLISFDATVGRIKIGCNGAFSSGIRRVYSKDGFIKNSFIYFWLKTPYIQNTILEYSSGTTILHAGNSIEFLKILFNKDIINKFQKIADPIFNKILEINKENQKLASLRDLFLPKLMSGEIIIN